MKVRYGFVSNSSSSSFAVFAVPMTIEQAASVLMKDVDLNETINIPQCKHEFDRENMKFCPECGAKRFIVKKKIEEIDYGLIEKKAEEHNLSFVCVPCDECKGYYLGVDIESLTDDNDQLKKVNKAAEEIKKLTGQNGRFYSGTYYS